MVELGEGNMFATPANIRVNTVNCVGVMGVGVALAFKNRYPKMFKEYQRECNAGRVKPGKLHIWESPSGKLIVNFPTKRHWQEPSRYEDIEAGLTALHTFLLKQTEEVLNLRVVLPALGCGHGGLDWDRVFPMITKHLFDVKAQIIVFNPLTSRTIANSSKS